MSTKQKVSVDTIDYLTEDPVMTGQKWVCVSFLKPSQFKCP